MQHSFIRIEDISKQRHRPENSEVAVSWNGMIAGALVVCAQCGQVRKIWADGVVEVAEGSDHCNGTR